MSVEVVMDARMTDALQRARDAAGPGWSASVLCSLGGFGLDWTLIVMRIVTFDGSPHVDTYSSGQYQQGHATYAAAMTALEDVIRRGVTVEQMEAR